ncbi:hypothetical protein PFICI_08713 [Pestalotiopsis fici W106-1]|uniref:Genetic interactor of prohibitins 3, mitochondrial n=1 Tax=Pestalotiopsis fici (strain W106-1 / CGMCC3.15140) TaxID=1229662 RepID=W3WYD8_PESFW|nr:uncharacterized protein PFICI_08713 [Pestalotiopsis fici W106-1]ETS78860.1 hypothetical protein PFICI_08713 [Pestalotiopsis fici W106-1]
MHRSFSKRWLNTALRTKEVSTTALELPVFLCPSLAAHNARPQVLAGQVLSSRSQWRLPSSRCLHVPTSTPTAAHIVENDVHDVKPIRKLPAQCTGCGALSQTSHSDQPGYFDLGRKVVRRYIGLEQPQQRQLKASEREEDEVFRRTIESVDMEKLKTLGVDVDDIAPTLAPQPDRVQPEAPLKTPLCDRCHTLMHHQTGVSIYHPTIDSIRDTLEESPYKYNHVYHVLDAADFPMSLLPKIHSLLHLMPLRSKNRRSRAGKFYHGQKTEMSFVITRADLLAPTKPQVDRLVPYLREVLRDALGRTGEDLRLGNIRCVSSRRSWWTKELKEDIWNRGGAGWLVGKVNVGKSQLFEAVFPKGRMDWDPSSHQIKVDMFAKDDPEPPTKLREALQEIEEDANSNEMIAKLEADKVDEYSLLPPAPPETQYPEMPLVSDLPGTTASPIRVPFGNGKGELIDLPGLERTGLEKYVKDGQQTSLILRSRVVPEQMVLKQGKSVLLGGLIRITPRVPGPIIMSYAFTPLEAHLTSTDKAIAVQTQTSTLNIDSIAAPGTGEKIKHAGSFALKWDVTKERAGPITAKHSVNIKVDRLPYRVLAADILIEGVGWVEVVAQVRTRDLYERRAPTAPEAKPEAELTALERLDALAEGPKKEEPRRPARTDDDNGDGEPNWPIVDVYSPEGKFIGYRRPMNGWLLNKPRVTAASQRSRPRKSMKGAKKLEKQRRRAAE